MVFAYHAHRPVNAHILNAFCRMGLFGVGVFFVLSAYLITELMLREWEKIGTIDLRKFYVRRVLRIWPVYFLSLGIAVVAGLVWPSFHVTAGTALAYTFLAGNYYQAYHSLPALLYPFWTLSIEEQFYAVAPSVMKRFGAKGLKYFVAVTLTVAYAAIFTYAGMHHEGYVEIVHYDSFVEFQFFSVGTLLALILHGKAWAPVKLVRVALFLFGIMTMAAAIGVFHIDSGDPTPAIQLAGGYFVLLLGTVSILLAFLQWRVESQIISAFAYLGKISYGLYMYHLFALTGVFAYAWTRGTGRLSSHPLFLDAVAFFLTVAAASLSFRYFERPLLKQKSRFEVVSTVA